MKRAMFRTIYGVDFSGAKEAGRNIWIARCEIIRAPRRRARLSEHESALRLVELDSLETLCGTSQRAAALAYLVEAIKNSRRALWAIDFPFGLPIELFDESYTWLDQLNHLAAHAGDAATFGRACVTRAQSLGGPMHIFRQCDRGARTPFDCYHYRIIYQTFHGMRDVLIPLRKSPGTAIAPFDGEYHRSDLIAKGRVIVEACPSSTLKHLKLPYQNYKQPTGGPLSYRQRRVRHTILAALAKHIEISSDHRRKIMRNPGGDALDAVIAAVGAHLSWPRLDHAAIVNHPRHPREGYVYFS